jgi:hypothetical protein
MSGAELKAIAQSVYGRYGWQRKLADHMGVDVATIRRWVMMDELREVTAERVRWLAPTGEAEAAERKAG